MAILALPGEDTERATSIPIGQWLDVACTVQTLIVHYHTQFHFCANLVKSNQKYFTCPQGASLCWPGVADTVLYATDILYIITCA